MQTILPGSDAYYSMRKLPKLIKIKINAVLQLFDQLLSIPVSVSNDEIAHAKLQWWSNELRLCIQNQGTHPLSPVLYQIISDHQIKANTLQLVINAVENTVQHCQFDSEQALRDYYAYTVGIRERIIAKICGIDQQTSQSVADISTVEGINSLAYCLGLIDHLKQLRHNAVKLYSFFSDETLQALALSKTELYSLATNTKIEQLIQTTITKAEQAYQQGLDLLSKPQQQLLQCLIKRCKLALAWTKLLPSEHYQILERQISLTPIRKLLLTLRR